MASTREHDENHLAKTSIILGNIFETDLKNLAWIKVQTVWKNASDRYSLQTLPGLRSSPEPLN